MQRKAAFKERFQAIHQRTLKRESTLLPPKFQLAAFCQPTTLLLWNSVERSSKNLSRAGHICYQYSTKFPFSKSAQMWVCVNQLFIEVTTGLLQHITWDLNSMNVFKILGSAFTCFFGQINCSYLCKATLIFPDSFASFLPFQSRGKAFFADFSSQLSKYYLPTHIPSSLSLDGHISIHTHSYRSSPAAKNCCSLPLIIASLVCFIGLYIYA